MELRPEEISRIIRSQIKHYEAKINQSETGTVILIGDGIAKAAGLTGCMVNELLEFPGGVYGMAQNLEENSVSIVMLGNEEGIREGDTVRRTGRVVSVPVGYELIGRVVDALGQPIDGKGPIETDKFRRVAPCDDIDKIRFLFRALGSKIAVDSERKGRDRHAAAGPAQLGVTGKTTHENDLVQHE